MTGSACYLIGRGPRGPRPLPFLAGRFAAAVPA